MPDEVVDVSAPEGAPTESSPVLSIPADADGYSEWRLTGKLPEKKEKPSKPEESAAPDKSAEGDEPEGKTAPAPEAGSNKQEQQSKPPRSDAASRLNEILADLKRAGLSPSELKTFKREFQQPQAKPPETTVQPPAPPKPPELKEPQFSDFPTVDGWAKAMREYNQQLARNEAQQQIQQFLQQQQIAAVNQAAAQKLQEAKRIYGDEAESSIVSAAQSIYNDAQVHPAVKGLLNDSSVMHHMLYVMGANEAEFRDFLDTSRSNPGEAIRRLVTLENLVKEELRKGQSSNGQEQPQPARGENGQFVSNKPPPAKKPSEAPPPAREVSGRGSLPPDEVSAAFQRNDFSAFRNAANRRDMAQKQGR